VGEGTPGQRFEFFRGLLDYFTRAWGGERRKTESPIDTLKRRRRIDSYYNKKINKEEIIWAFLSSYVYWGLYSYLAELAFPAYAYVDGHLLLSLLPLLGRRQHPAAISSGRLHITSMWGALVLAQTATRCARTHWQM
jgi:hypothetical protein